MHEAGVRLRHGARGGQLRRQLPAPDTDMHRGRGRELGGVRHVAVRRAAPHRRPRRGQAACTCACRGGYTNNLRYGIAGALLHTGPGCVAACPGAENVSQTYVDAKELPGPSDNVTTQQASWDTYSEHVCNGHGACTTNVEPCTCECIEGFFGPQCNASCTENALPAFVQTATFCDAFLSVCNFGQCILNDNVERCTCNTHFALCHARSR